MINLYDNRDSQHLGQINQTQLQFLMDSMEEESTTDQDYYLEPATVDYLEARGADMELTTLLRAILGDRDNVTIRWEEN
jgi:hypothetical protein